MSCANFNCTIYGSSLRCDGSCSTDCPRCFVVFFVHPVVRPPGSSGNRRRRASCDQSHARMMQILQTSFNNVLQTSSRMNTENIASRDLTLPADSHSVFIFHVY